MEVIQSIEIFYGVWILIIGLSLFTAHNQWKKLIASWLDHPEQYFVLAFVFMPIGIFTILLHNVWTGLGIIVSLLGWLVTIKAVMIFCFPSLLYKFVNTSLLKRKLFIMMSIIYSLLGILILFATMI